MAGRVDGVGAGVAGWLGADGTSGDSPAVASLALTQLAAARRESGGGSHARRAAVVVSSGEPAVPAVPVAKVIGAAAQVAAPGASATVGAGGLVRFLVGNGLSLIHI